jgi:hypothetical protein
VATVVERGGTRRVALGAALVSLAVVVPLLRQRGNPSWDSLWAEDGFLLLQDVVDGDAVGQLFDAYAGYLVVVPRLLALPVALVPIDRAPLYFAVVGALVCAGLAALTYRWTEGWIRSPAVRLLVAAFVCLSPAAGHENTATLVNVIWAFAMVAPWALLARQRGWLDVVARAVVLVGAVTSTPTGLGFLPLAALVWWRRRDRATTIVVAAYAIGAALQAFVMVTADELVVADPERPLEDFVRLIGVRIAGVFLVGPEQAAALWRDHGAEVGVVATVLVLGLFALVLPGAGRRGQAVGAMFLAYAYLSFVALLWSRGTGPFRFGGFFNMIAHMRYSVLAVFFVECAFACVVSPGDRSRGDLRGRTGLPAFLVHGVLLIVLCFAVVAYRGLGPTWSEHVDRARSECAEAGAGADQIVVVPQDDVPFWGVQVPCGDLGSG